MKSPILLIALLALVLLKPSEAAPMLNLPQLFGSFLDNVFLVARQMTSAMIAVIGEEEGIPVITAPPPPHLNGLLTSDDRKPYDKQKTISMEVY